MIKAMQCYDLFLMELKLNSELKITQLGKVRIYPDRDQISVFGVSGWS